jgi:hypothetical protein
MATDTLTTQMIYETCCNCFVVFGMTQELYRQRKQDGRSFYCPNGHGQYYSKSTESTLKEKLKAAEENARWWKGEAEFKSRQVSNRQGQITKIKNSIKQGFCPLCNDKHFPDLETHMCEKHPNYSSLK